MSTLLAGAGTLILLALAYDVGTTTLVTGRRAGPLSGWLSRSVAHLLTSRARRPPSILVTWSGPLAVVTIIVTWLVMLWSGWSLLFLSHPRAVVEATTGVPADAWSRLYYTAVAAFTLGFGDFVPGTVSSQALTGVALVSGLALTSMAITYLVPVVTAVVEQRYQARRIASLGATPHGVVVGAWDHGTTPHLQRRLESLADDVLLAAVRGQSYPTLQLFESSDAEGDLRLQAWFLDDVLMLLEHGLASGRPPTGLVADIRHAIDQLMTRTRPPRWVEPRRLDLAPLRRAGLPVVTPELFRRALAREEERRARIASIAAMSPWYREATPQASAGRGARTDVGCDDAFEDR